MNFQIIKDDYYDNIYDRLKELIPEFIPVSDKEDGVYPVVGDFYDFIVANDKNDKVLSKCVMFINEALDREWQQIEELIVVQIFEPLYTNVNLTSKLEQKFSEKAKQVFDAFRTKL